VVNPGYFTLVAIFIIVTLLAIILLIFYRVIINRIFSLPKDNPKEFVLRLGKNPSSFSNKKRIVFIGDSLTHGNMSVNYLEIIAKKLGNDTFDYINGGLNASLAYNILERLDDIILCKPDYAIVLIGTNDAHRSIKLYKHSITNRKLHLPQDPDKKWFIENLRKIITTLQQKTNANIALCSIPPIGEETTHIVFKQSIDYSKTIQKIAKDMNVGYLPVNERMRKFLEQNPSKPKYPIEHKLDRSTAIKYFIQHLSLDEISRKNGFSLLVDHIHLNSKGANILAELIVNYIQEN
jgi:lysophospholipase L1-like esterase